MFFPLFRAEFSEFYYTKKQEVGVDLCVCVLKLLREVSTLPSLVRISIVNKRDIGSSNYRMTSYWSCDQRMMEL